MKLKEIQGNEGIGYSIKSLGKLKWNIFSKFIWNINGQRGWIARGIKFELKLQSQHRFKWKIIIHHLYSAMLPYRVLNAPLAINWLAIHSIIPNLLNDGKDYIFRCMNCEKHKSDIESCNRTWDMSDMNDGCCMQLTIVICKK